MPGWWVAATCPTRADEKPQRSVFLDGFWIDQTEVSNAMVARCIRDGACQPLFGKDVSSSLFYLQDPKNEAYPIAGVTWEEAQTYCSWAGGRVPTEAEWEKAARGTAGQLYPWGIAAPQTDRLNYHSEIGHTTPVGSYPAGASPYGALDMAGNLWEWVADWYSNVAYASALAADPPGPAPQIFHDYRGGSWNNTADWVRAAMRVNDDPGKCDGLTGIRCASSAP
jgi:formylglycine-generating enzyme required for sulfatase activity